MVGIDPAFGRIPLKAVGTASPVPGGGAWPPPTRAWTGWAGGGRPTGPRAARVSAQPGSHRAGARLPGGVKYPENAQVREEWPAKISVWEPPHSISPSE